MTNRNLWIMAAVIALTSFFVFLPAAENDFVNWDDDQYVTNNPDLSSPAPDFVKWALTTRTLGNWHPITWFSLRLDYALWGLDPAGYHLTNIILHSLNTLIVVLLTALLSTRAYRPSSGSPLLPAALTGIVFGIHPLHVESVAWISERKDVLYALFWLLSVAVYLLYTSAREQGRRRRYYWTCLLLFALALLSKPMAVTLPLVLLILDYFPLRRLAQKTERIKVALHEKLPFYILSLVFSLVTVAAQKESDAIAGLGKLSSWERSWTALKALCFYLTKTLWPVDLVPFYPLKPDVSPMAPEYLGSVVFVLCVTVLCIWVRKRIPVLTAAWMYFVITLLPVLGFIQVGAQAAADRYMYLALLGPLMLIAASSSKVWEMGGGARYALVAAVVVCVIGMSALTVRQISVWRDSVTLWEFVTAREPGAVRAHYNLGNAYREAGDLMSAERAWRSTLEAAPAHSMALNQLGNIYHFSSRLPEAKEYYSAAVKADGENTEARYNLALTMDKMNESAEALKHYQVFLETGSAEFEYLVPEVRERISTLKALVSGGL